MDTVSLLSSVSKIALIAFGITLAIVLFEIYVLVSHRKKDEVVSVPEFKGDPLKTRQVTIKSAGVYQQERLHAQEERKKRVKLVSYLVSFAVLLAVTIVGIELMIRSRGEKAVQQETPAVLPTHVPTETVEEPVSFEEFGLDQELSATPTPVASITSTQPSPTTSLTLTPTPTSIIIVQTGTTSTPTQTPTPTQTASQLPASGMPFDSLGAIGIFILFISLAFIF